MRTEVIADLFVDLLNLRFLLVCKVQWLQGVNLQIILSLTGVRKSRIAFDGMHETKTRQTSLRCRERTTLVMLSQSVERTRLEYEES